LYVGINFSVGVKSSELIDNLHELV